jgi:hypothetical protein
MKKAKHLIPMYAKNLGKFAFSANMAGSHTIIEIILQS